MEIEVESILHTLDAKFIREAVISGINVDFMIEGQFVLEIMGPHHYTVEGKLKGRDIVRKLVLEQWYPVKFMTHEALNQTVGMQNKLNLLNSLLKENK